MKSLLELLFGPIHIHKWNKWQVIKKGDITFYSQVQNKNIVKGSWLLQQRECQLCGKIEQDQIEN